MTQLSEEQQERLKQVRLHHCPMTHRECPTPKWQMREDIEFLLSLLDSEGQAAAEGIADDLPYRIVDEMGLGLTFRSCTCGQLPCARLRPLRDALQTVRRDTTTAMRDKCVDAIKSLRATPHGAAYNNAINDAIHKVESLTLAEKQK